MTVHIEKRDRYQLVVSLGDGQKGFERRTAIERSAARVGLSLSAWARHVLLDAAGLQDDEWFVTRAEVRWLIERAERVKDKDGAG